MPTDEFEQSTRENITARRNHLMALWAGKQLGLSGVALNDYAMALHAADFEEAGPADVLRKIETDLTAANIVVRADLLQLALTQSETTARRELLATD